VFLIDLLVRAQLSWSKSLVRKWFNIKSKPQDFHADYDASQGNATAAVLWHSFDSVMSICRYFFLSWPNLFLAQFVAVKRMPKVATIDICVLLLLLLCGWLFQTGHAV
jgi:hypothetical protein